MKKNTPPGQPGDHRDHRKEPKVGARLELEMRDAAVDISITSSDSHVAIGTMIAMAIHKVPLLRAAVIAALGAWCEDADYIAESDTLKQLYANEMHKL